MKQVLAQLREPPAQPAQDAIPYIGDHPIYEETIRVAAGDRIALNVGNTWYRAEPDELVDQAYGRLRRACFRTGRELEEVQLGMPSQVGSGGIVVGGNTGETGTLFPPVTPPTGSTLVPPVIQPPEIPQPPPVAPPVILQSNGAKSGINLLGDIERWGLPDRDRLTVATLTMRGLTVKELRDLCTKMPSKLLAELQITSTPEQQGGTVR